MATKQSSSSNGTYGEASIRVLKGLEPVKQRPGMYTRTDNPLHIIQEVLDNAADEALAGFGKKIKVLLNTDFFSLRNRLNKEACLIYSGPIDRFFDYKYGKLSWRTLRFEQETIDREDYQGNSVINFPEAEIPFTRIHEPRHLHPEKQYPKDKTIIFREYSLADQGDNPYYPIASADNQRLLDDNHHDHSQPAPQGEKAQTTRINTSFGLFWACRRLPLLS